MDVARLGYAAISTMRVFTILLLWLPALSGADEVNVAVASNFAPTLAALQTQFEAAGPHRLRVSSGSSGKLFAQIVNGAPFDVFLAADDDYPRRLIELGRARRGSQVTYATGRLVVWSTTLPLSADLRELKQPVVRHIAIANPSAAPYGRAARQALQSYGLAKVTAAKIVVGESVAQAAQFVATGNAEAGFVALAQVLALPEARRGFVVELPASGYPELRHDAVLLSAARGATEFLEFLRGSRARATIRHAGYQVPPE